jgi:hypothetical protein
VKDKESLQAGAVISHLADAIKDQVNNLLARGVVSAGVVVGSIFLSVDDLLGVIEVLVLSGTDFVTDRGLQVNKDGTRDVLSRGGLAEEGVEGVIRNAQGGVAGHLSIGRNAVLQAVELPALVARLDTGLTEVNRDAF